MFYSYTIYNFCRVFFFFQAEDGIRDKLVPGVQTCALPILKRCHLVRPPVPWVPLRGGAKIRRALSRRMAPRRVLCAVGLSGKSQTVMARAAVWRVELRGRSEERRVGKEGRRRAPREQRTET